MIRTRMLKAADELLAELGSIAFDLDRLGAVRWLAGPDGGPVELRARRLILLSRRFQGWAETLMPDSAAGLVPTRPAPQRESMSAAKALELVSSRGKAAGIIKAITRRLTELETLGLGGDLLSHASDSERIRVSTGLTQFALCLVGWAVELRAAQPVGKSDKIEGSVS